MITISSADAIDYSFRKIEDVMRVHSLADASEMAKVVDNIQESFGITGEIKERMYEQIEGQMVAYLSDLGHVEDEQKLFELMLPAGFLIVGILLGLGMADYEE